MGIILFANLQEEIYLVDGRLLVKLIAMGIKPIAMGIKPIAMAIIIQVIHLAKIMMGRWC